MSDDAERREALKTVFHNLSFTDISKQNPDVTLTDGAIVLGRGGATGNTYITRYRIDHVRERHHATRAVFTEECVPCTAEENRETAKSCLWNFISSEAFLFSLHMTALALGVAKEAMDVRDYSEDLELVHSLIETVVALLMISIRMSMSWTSFKELSDIAYEYEHITKDGEYLRGRSLRRWRNLVVGLGACMMAVAIICFLLFKFLVHLGWTILSNNFAMIVFTVVAGLYSSRVDNTQAKIREDQHKAVLYEATLLLKETNDPSTYARKEFKDKLIRFVKSVEDTSFLQLPEHIGVAEDNSSLRTSMLVAMEMQSGV